MSDLMMLTIPVPLVTLNTRAAGAHSRLRSKLICRILNVGLHTESNLSKAAAGRRTLHTPGHDSLIVDL